MIDPELVAKIDQASEALGEFIPQCSKRLYDGFLREGFSEEQAMELTKTYVEVTFKIGELK